MKKLLITLLCVVLVFGLCACSSDSNNANNNDAVDTTENNSGNNTNNDPEKTIEVSSTQLDESYVVEMNYFPTCVDDLQAFDLTNEYEAAAAIICVLTNFENNFDTAFEMMDYVMGPESPNDYDKSFIKNQLEQYPYVMRSYYEGATPDNDYASTSLKLTFTENAYSRDEDGYVKLYIKSSGADSERGLTLRQKASTQEWFLFSDTYKGLMAGIRAPGSEDPWN